MKSVVILNNNIILFSECIVEFVFTYTPIKNYRIKLLLNIFLE